MYMYVHINSPLNKCYFPSTYDRFESEYLRAEDKYLLFADVIIFSKVIYAFHLFCHVTWSGVVLSGYGIKCCVLSGHVIKLCCILSDHVIKCCCVLLGHLIKCYCVLSNNVIQVFVYVIKCCFVLSGHVVKCCCAFVRSCDQVFLSGHVIISSLELQIAKFVQPIFREEVSVATSSVTRLH